MPSLTSSQAYQAEYPKDPMTPYSWHSPKDFETLQQQNEALNAKLAAQQGISWGPFVVGFVLGAVIVWYFQKKSTVVGRRDQAGYEMIP